MQNQLRDIEYLQRPRPNDRIVIQKPSATPAINTRYSSNTDWGHETKFVIQAGNESHFHITENDRLSTDRPWSDVQQIQQRKNYIQKIKALRYKNESTLAPLFLLSS